MIENKVLGWPFHPKRVAFTMSSTCGRDVRVRLALLSQMSLSRKHRLGHHELHDRHRVSHHLSKKLRLPFRVPQGVNLSKGSSPSKARNIFAQVRHHKLNDWKQSFGVGLFIPSVSPSRCDRLVGGTFGLGWLVCPKCRFYESTHLRQALWVITR